MWAAAAESYLLLNCKSVCAAARAQFPEVYGILQRPAQWAEAELVVSDVQRRTRHQLFQKPIHSTGVSAGPNTHRRAHSHDYFIFG